MEVGLLLGVEFSLKNIVEGFEDFRRHVGRQVMELTLVSFHGPVREEGMGGLGLGVGVGGLVLSDLFVVTEEVIPFVVALVLATETAMVPAIVFDPFPP